MEGVMTEVQWIFAGVLVCWAIVVGSLVGVTWDERRERGWLIALMWSVLVMLGLLIGQLAEKAGVLK